MKNLLKYGLTFVGGMLVGVAAMKVYFDKNFDIVKEEENETEEPSQEVEVQNEEPSQEVEVRNEETVETVEYSEEENNDFYEDMNTYRNIVSQYDESDCQETFATESDFNGNIIPDYKQNLASTYDDYTLKPYHITQNEFTEIETYDFDSFTYYPDGYVSDSDGMPINNDDLVKMFGTNWESMMDFSDGDEIFIRNDRLQCDFSIVRDLDNFQDIADPRIKKLL